MSKIKKSRIIFMVLGILILAIISLGVYYHFVLIDILMPEEIKNIDKIRSLVLYETDHNALLVKCREMMKKTSDSGTHFEKDALGLTEPVKLYPKKMLNLEPTWVYIYPDMVDIELCTSFYSVSINAFPEGVEGGGDKKLLDGLWYNDKGYKIPKFEEYLQSLKPQK